jgi:hypothetical protein
MSWRECAAGFLGDAWNSGRWVSLDFDLLCYVEKIQTDLTGKPQGRGFAESAMLRYQRGAAGC